MGRKYNPNYNYQNGRLSDRFTSPPEVVDENATYNIGFRYYNERACNLDGARLAELRKIIEVLSRVGKCRQYGEFKDKVAQEFKPVFNTGHYAKFFSGLTPDVDLLEFDVGSRRGFFFFEHPAKLLQMVAIDKHPEYKKNKR